MTTKLLNLCLAVLLSVSMARVEADGPPGSKDTGGKPVMKAGFAKVCITPPRGTTMYGFSSRDRDHGCEGVHDDLFVCACYLSQGAEEALIMGFDLLFFSRANVDRFKGALARRFGLEARQVLLNTSHTHCGPVTGTIWAFADFDKGPDKLYEDEVERAILRAAAEARESAREVTVWAGATRSSVPMSRRRKDANGNMLFAPNPQGVVCDHLPVCLLKDGDGRPVCLLFSISCHPSTTSGFLISADYPGPAMDMLDKHLGAPCSVFLQGCGGDAKARIIGDGERFRSGTWEEVAQTGRAAAQEVIQALQGGLAQVVPDLRCGLIDMEWPLQPALDRAGYAAIAADPKAGDLKRLWAGRQVEKLDRGWKLPSAVPITLHGIQIGKGLRLVGLEGEAVAGLGLVMLDFYRDKGVAFPLSYTDGAQLYLPTSAMLDEGGYEAVSYHEYGWPAPFVKGMEKIITDSLEKLRTEGIE